MIGPTAVLEHGKDMEGNQCFTVAGEFASAVEARKWLREDCPEGTFTLVNVLTAGIDVKTEQTVSRNVSAGQQIRTHRASVTE